MGFCARRWVAVMGLPLLVRRLPPMRMGWLRDILGDVLMVGLSSLLVLLCRSLAPLAPVVPSVFWRLEAGGGEPYLSSGFLKTAVERRSGCDCEGVLNGGCDDGVVVVGSDGNEDGNDVTGVETGMVDAGRVGVAAAGG